MHERYKDRDGPGQSAGKAVKKRSPAIMHIVNIPWYSGLAGYAEDMAVFSRKSGHEVIFAAVEDSPLMEKVKKNFKTIPLNGRRPADTIRSIKTIRKSLDGVDMIFAHTGSSFFLAVAASLFKKVRVFNIIMHKFAFGVVAPTGGIKKIFLDFGIPEDKIYYLPPVVDSDIFYPQPLKSANTIGIVGRLDRVKGHEVLIDSLPLVKEEIEDIKVIVIGDEKGVKEKDLIQKARKLGVADSLKFMGKVRYETIPAIMAECRAGIIPSLGSEAVSRAAVEWMAAGRPVIASRVGCLEEIIINNYNGFSVSPGDPEELGIRIIELLKVGELNSQMAEKAEIYARRHFTPKVYRKYLKKILDE
jgi:glycosyltransferase involved in cell wall biosynthesis